MLDAGAFARFGRIEVQPGSSGYEIMTRSGNVEQPVRGWSDWEPLKDGEIASPAGRFLQWKAILHPGGVLGAVGVNYLPVNSAPVVDELVVVTGARLNPQNQPNPQQQTVTINFPSANQGPAMTFEAPSNNPITAMKDKTAITARWAAHDDNGDDLAFSLYMKGDNENVWRLLKDNITEKAYSFDASLLPDGGYQIKVMASDAPSHSPGEALTGFKESDRFEVDTTPPVVSNLKANEQAAAGGCPQAPCGKPVVFTFDAEDLGSPICSCRVLAGCGPVAIHRAGGRAVGFQARALRGAHSWLGVQRQGRRASAHGARLRPARQRGAGQDRVFDHGSSGGEVNTPMRSSYSSRRGT